MKSMKSMKGKAIFEKAASHESRGEMRISILPGTQRSRVLARSLDPEESPCDSAQATAIDPIQAVVRRSRRTQVQRAFSPRNSA